MKFGDIITSSIDFPGKMSLVLFTGGCVFRCPYCHNPELVDGGREVEVEEIILEIEKSKCFIDGVVISGGEPIHQSNEVKEILKYCKTRGLSTKLDTNGYSPKYVKNLIKWLDYIALDIKAPFNKYEKITKCDKGKEVKRSMEICLESDIYLECRTTYVPDLIRSNDIIEIARNIDCDLYTLQQFNNKSVLDERLYNTRIPSRNELKEIAESIMPFLSNINIKTSEFGCEIIKREKISHLSVVGSF